MQSMCLLHIIPFNKIKVSNEHVQKHFNSPLFDSIIITPFHVLFCIHVDNFVHYLQTDLYLNWCIICALIN